MVTTGDTWFRPSDICAGPDGSVFVADWNDAGVGGHNMADQAVADMTGRIYRIAPETPGRERPKGVDLRRAATPWYRAGADGCVEALQSPNLSTRYLAWTRLHELQGKAEKALLKLWKGKDARMKARALQLVARIHGREKHYVLEAIS